MNSRLEDWIQAHVARAALPPSSVRGKGSAGVAKAGRAFLRRLDLAPFGRAGADRFAASLDTATEELRRALPRDGRSWGLARKMLNLFLRDALYTTHLERRYGLSVNEAHFELPLDKFTGSELVRLAEGKLPSWPGVRALRRQESARYQEAALEHARKARVARVHLDALWWGARAEED